MADLDLRPERRSLLASELCTALGTLIPGSETALRGSLAAGTADRYSDIDIGWTVPDQQFGTVVRSVTSALRSVRTVAALRIDPSMARSDRLVFVRLADIKAAMRHQADVAEGRHGATHRVSFADTSPPRILMSWLPGTQLGGASLASAETEALTLALERLWQSVPPARQVPHTGTVLNYVPLVKRVRMMLKA